MGFTVNLSLSLPNLLRCLITVYSTVGISGRREALDFSTIEGKLIDVVHTLRHPFYPSPPSNALLIYALSPATAKKDCLVLCVWFSAITRVAASKSFCLFRLTCNRWPLRSDQELNVEIFKFWIVFWYTCSYSRSSSGGNHQVNRTFDRGDQQRRIRHVLVSRIASDKVWN